MSNFTGQKIANTYKNLLQVNTSNSDLSSTLISVETGAGNTTPLQLATDKVNINGTFQLGGVTLTANVTALNNIADLSGITGIVVGDSGTLTGRTLVGASPISITNANGVAGNPTINLATTGITSATYGPLGRFNIDTYGRVIDVSIATTVSANSFIGGVFNGSSLTVENNTSIGGDVVIAGTTNMKAVSATDATLNNLTVGTKITAATVTATTVETSILRATKASITDLTADTISFENVSVSTINATNIIAVSANATRLFKNGEDVATSATVAALSATMATSIDNANTNITTNTNAITSINSVIANLSSTLATSISERTQSITSINGVITDLSATLATSIGNRTVAITSINTVITNLSSTIATSINNSNINITANTNAITSINTVVSDLSATLATSIANHMPLSGGTFTGSVILNADPASNLQPATKQYVDNLTAAALHFHEAVRLESPINLTATYNNGTAGVGATLTNSGTQVALSIDGVATQVNDRILIYEQTDQTQNGVYVVTNIGSGSTNWVLTRSSDTNTSGDSDANSLDEGSYFFVTEGDTGAGESYVCNTQGVITFGTTNITFIQFSSALNYTAGTNIDISTSRVISAPNVATTSQLDTTNANVTTNLNAITSINTVVTDLSATLATSIANVAAGADPIPFAIALG